MSLLLVIGSLLAGDVQRLDADSYETREAAHARLKRCGLVAAPSLLDGMRSESPEVRKRCAELLAGWRRLNLNLAAAKAIMGAEGVDYEAFYRDERTRLAVHRIAMGMECRVGVDWLLPENERRFAPWWWPEFSAPLMCHGALLCVRGHWMKVAKP